RFAGSRKCRVAVAIAVCFAAGYSGWKSKKLKDAERLLASEDFASGVTCFQSPQGISLLQALYGKDTFENVTSVSVQTENAARVFAAMRAASTFPSLREVLIDAETVPELRAHTLHHIASFNSIETVSVPFVRLQGSDLAILRTMGN